MVNACYFVQSQLVVTAVRDSGKYSWLCIVSSTSTTQQRAMRAAANPFSVTVNIAVSGASRVVEVGHLDEVCLSTYIKDVAPAQKLFCDCFFVAHLQK